MSTKKFIVAAGNSIFINGPLLHTVKGKDTLSEGEEIPEGLFDSDKLARLLAAGKIKRVGGDIEKDPEPEIGVGVEGQLIKEKPLQPEHRPVGPMNVDPAKLKGKTLDQLKVMIAEKDPRIDASAIKDEESAVKILTADFVPPAEKPKAPPKPAKKGE